LVKSKDPWLEKLDWTRHEFKYTKKFKELIESNELNPIPNGSEIERNRKYLISNIKPDLSQNVFYKTSSDQTKKEVYFLKFEYNFFEEAE
jgi:hypothetical protein